MSLDVWNLKPIQSYVASMFFRHKRLVVCLPRQEGKTELLVRLLHSCLLSPERLECAFFAKDAGSMRTMANEKFIRLFEKENFKNKIDSITNATTGSILWKKTCDKDAGRNRGGTFSMVGWAEMAFAKIDGDTSIADFFRQNILPPLKEQKGYFFGESTANGRNAFADMCTHPEEFGLKSVVVGMSRLLELQMISKEDYEFARAGQSELSWDQEYECKFITATGLTYIEFNENKFVVPVPDPTLSNRVHYAIDWGWNPSATCVLFGYLRDGYLVIFDEIYGTEILPKNIEKSIETTLQKYRLTKNGVSGVSDHDAEKIAAMQIEGFNVENANKTNVFGTRLRLKNLIYQGKLLVHSRCQYLIRDLTSATWNGKADNDIDYSKCTYGHYDAEAALRYLFTSLFGS